TTDDVSNIRHVIFHFANLPNLNNAIRHRWDYQPQLPRGRSFLELPPWQMIIDPLPDSQAREDELFETTGYALTHVGRLEKVTAAIHLLVHRGQRSRDRGRGGDNPSAGRA